MMMKNSSLKTLLFTTVILSALALAACQPQETETATTLEAVNNSDAPFEGVVELNLQDQEIFQNDVAIYDGDTAVPYQIVEASESGERALLAYVQLNANESKEFSVRELKEEEEAPEFEKMTQAELWIKEGGEFVDNVYEGGSFVRTDSLRVPEGFTDHAYYIKYEGPGWESDKVGYRFYLDWRNAVDVFGKKVSSMVLNEVGQDGYDSYHEPGDWGMDVMKVGESLGIGSIGYWNGEKALRVAETDSVVCKITKDGALRSEVRTDYYGWAVSDTTKFDMTSYISIDAGARMSNQLLVFPENSPDNICSGIAKDPNAELIEMTLPEGDWACIATWGKQSLANDSLGLALFYRQSDLIERTEDNLNHVVVLRPENNQVEYYFAAAWEQEKDGVKNRVEFENYLNDQLMLLNTPVSVSMSD